MNNYSGAWQGAGRSLPGWKTGLSIAAAQFAAIAVLPLLLELERRPIRYRLGFQLETH